MRGIQWCSARSYAQNVYSLVRLWPQPQPCDYIGMISQCRYHLPQALHHPADKQVPDTPPLSVFSPVLNSCSTYAFSSIRLLFSQCPILTEQGFSSSQFLQHLAASNAQKQAVSPSTLEASLEVQNFPVGCFPGTPGGRFLASPDGKVHHWLFHNSMSHGHALSKGVWISAYRSGRGLFLGTLLWPYREQVIRAITAYIRNSLYFLLANSIILQST